MYNPGNRRARPTLLHITLRKQTVRSIQLLFSIFMAIALLTAQVPTQPMTHTAFADIESPDVPAADVAEEITLEPLPTPDVGGDSDPLDAPAVITATDVVDPHLPTLTVDITTDVDTIRPGDPFVVTLNVFNSAPDPANNLVVTMPLPEGTTPYDESEATEFTWTQDVLDPEVSASFSITLTHEIVPLDVTVLVEVQADADGLSAPISAEGGLVNVIGQCACAGDKAFTAGKQTTLDSPDGRVSVRLPANAYKGDLTLHYDTRPPNNERAARGAAAPTLKGGLRPFYLSASDAKGTQVHQFAAPLTLTAHYTPQQLRALHIPEESVTLFWYDDSQKDGATWVPLATTVDPLSHSASVAVSHFSTFALGDGSSPSAAYIPSLQGFQTSLYTGGATYSYPIDVPAGPNGIKPDVSLSYSSDATDGSSGMNAEIQGGWTGKGWSLQPSYIALNRLANFGDGERYYSLVLNGQSYDMVRGAALVGSPSLEDPSDWAWYPTNESFLRVKVSDLGASSESRGMEIGDQWQHRYEWQIWTKDGTRFDFYEDAWQAHCEPVTPPTDPPTSYPVTETYKWYLSQTVDTKGNAISYSYNRSYQQLGTYCSVHGKNDYAVWPSEIAWGYNLNYSSTTTDTFKVRFVSSARSMDTQADSAPTQIGMSPRETRRLDAVQVLSKPSSAWKLVRQYNLSYANDAAHWLYSDQSVPSDHDGITQYNKNATYPKMTLTGIQRIAANGSITVALPSMVFTYGLARDSANTCYFPNGNWNRLVQADNGQGGTVTFNYANIGAVISGSCAKNPSTYAGLFRNNNRVTSRVETDGQGHSYTWNYSYTDPAYNTLGDADGQGPNTHPNSAQAWFAKYYSPEDADLNFTKALHQAKSEFRGHAKVVETDPNGNATEHWFYQGDLYFTGSTISCAISTAVNGESLWSNSCFQDLRDQEFLKGKEYQTVSHQGSSSGAKLSETDHHFAATFYGPTSGDIRFAGLWHNWNYEDETTSTAYDGGTTGLSQRATFSYDTTYGNLSEKDEYDESDALYRKTVYNYASNTSGANYIVDRVRVARVFDGSSNLLARTVYAYDGGSSGAATVGSAGKLTLVRKYYDIPATIGSPVTLHSNDTSYGYDNYGNQTTVTTYAGAGTGASDGSSYSAAGNGSSAYTTTTAYDSTFHVLPVTITPANSDLQETAAYTQPLGLLSSVTDANGNVSSAEYDLFGRMIKLVKPGDSSAAPTARFDYYDSEVPLRYVINQFEVSGSSSAYRPTQKYYDGMGRQIQEKVESTDLSGSVVTDFVYDGVGQKTKASQPRYVSGSGSAFTGYTAQGSTSVERWTTTSYDGLGRLGKVTAPDASVPVSMTYSIDTTTARRRAVTFDANGHKTARESDVFGRLVYVAEYDGSGSFYSGTTYDYSPLDLLTQVTDGNGKVTTISYDSLGRKTAMDDPTMGDWSYTYDVAGNLKTQTDAKSHTITFSYDNMNRLVTKSYSTGGSSVYHYDESGSSNGDGHRTSMERLDASSNVIASTDWDYNTHGQATQADYIIAGMNGTRSFKWSYDKADRQTALTYPSGEVVSYTYDSAWRQTSGCSNLPGTACYVASTTYSALGQVAALTFGSNVVQADAYDSPMARLSSIHVGSGASVLNRSYSYDDAGNVATIADGSETQTFSYDHRDRLTNWTATSINQSYAYDKIGNLTSKAGTTYSYTSTMTTDGGPYAVRRVGSTNLSYDHNGNLTNYGSNSYSWDTENQLSAATVGGIASTYDYDADNERVSQSGNGKTTYYVGGLYEEEGACTARSIYSVSGQTVGQRETSLCQPVSWTGATNVAVATNTITKTDSVGWTAGAASAQSIPAQTDGSVQITVRDLDTQAAFGLSHNNGGNNLTDIDFAIYLYPSDHKARVYEAGSSKATFATPYVVGSVLRVAIESGVVKYYQDDSLIYSSSATPSYPLLLDTGLYAAGSVLADAQIKTRAEPVMWTNATNGSVAGNSFTMTGGSGWVAGASSVQQIPAGSDGFVQYTIDSLTTAAMVGLSHSDSDAGYSSIDYAIYALPDSNDIRIYENGTLRGTFLTSYAIGDVLKVAAKTNGTVVYYVNGSTIYTSATTATFPLLVDLSMRTVSSTLNNVYVRAQLGAVNWVNPVNVSAVDHRLSKTTGGATWNAGASSRQVIPSGADGYVQAKITDTSHRIMLGLTHADINQNHNTIDYAAYLYTTDHTIQIYEDGVWQANLGAYVAGTLVKIALVGGQVRYYKDGVLLYVSATIASGSLLADTSFYDVGGVLDDVQFLQKDTLVYLHADQLGSVSAVSSSSGQKLSEQKYDPWGKLRSGDTPQTKIDYTGQKLDDTGLLYYHARYYDPNLARFISPDSIVPGTATGAEQNSRLTVDFHETGLAFGVSLDNAVVLQRGFWFQMTSQDAVRVPWGPTNPQALSRYTYVQDNPLSHTDPSGHHSCGTVGCGGRVRNDSSRPVRIYGTFEDTGNSCPGAKGCVLVDSAQGDGPKYAIQEWRDLPPNTSSDQLKAYDVDMVSAEDDNHPLYTITRMDLVCTRGECHYEPVVYPFGFDDSYEYKLSDTQEVVVQDTTYGGKTVQGIYSHPKGFWEGFVPTLGSGWKKCREAARCDEAPYQYQDVG